MLSALLQDFPEIVRYGPDFSFLVVETDHACFDGGHFNFSIIFNQLDQVKTVKRCPGWVADGQGDADGIAMKKFMKKLNMRLGQYQTEWAEMLF